MYVLLDDDLGRLTLRRLRPWHRILARGLAARLDRRLADGARPETSATLAARAMQLTAMGYRRDLAASLRKLLPAATHQLRVRACRERISGSAAELAELARRLAEPGPVPARGVAMVSRLLADGRGPLYHPACPDDLGVVVGRATRSLVR